MKVWGLGLFTALALSGSALADDQEDVGSWVSPRIQTMRAQWPKDAQGRQVYGRVKLSCTAGSNGFATDCTVKSSEPTNPALEAAALKLAPLFKARDRKAPRSILEIDMSNDVRADWLRKPTYDGMIAVYPAEALQKGQEGRVIIRCTVGVQGLLRACKVIQEDQPERGFGQAAVVWSLAFLMKPAMRDGAPVESEITIPIAFKTDGPSHDGPSTDGHTGSHIAGNDIAGSGPSPTPPGPIAVFNAAVWARTPSIADIQAELNNKVGDRFADGKVVLQCSVDKKSGALSDCVTANATPGMAQFQGVARSLTSKFKVDPEAMKTVKDKVKINLALSFPDMSSSVWGTRYLARTMWIRTPTVGPDEKLFPKDAAKAGLKTGKAIEDCIVAPNGDLTRCTTVSESIPGMGFGDMAQRIAMGFATNPWTDEGVPAEGAHVRMPVEMVNEEADQAAPSPTPATKP